MPGAEAGRRKYGNGDDRENNWSADNLFATEFGALLRDTGLQSVLCSPWEPRTREGSGGRATVTLSGVER
jgi:hypothetical protein